MTLKERERAFLIGAPLAIVPALVFLPAVVFLIVFPRVAHGGLIALLVLPGTVERLEFRGVNGVAGDRGLHGTVPGADDAETVAGLCHHAFYFSHFTVRSSNAKRFFRV
jgi:hypothetical protein